MRTHLTSHKVSADWLIQAKNSFRLSIVCVLFVCMRPYVRVRSQIPSPSHHTSDSLPACLFASQSFKNSTICQIVFAVTTQYIHSNLFEITETAWQNHLEIFYFYRVENEAVCAFECVINRA